MWGNGISQPGRGDKLPPPPPVRFKRLRRKWMAGQKAKFTLEGTRKPDDSLLSHELFSTILLPWSFNYIIS